MDEGVGRIRRELNELGLAENTILWFISDNGGTKGNYSTSPMTREGKASLYEGGHRVPGIVWAPGRVTPGICSELIVGMDLMPTSLSIAKVNQPKGVVLDGIDVGPALFDSKPLPVRPVIWGKGLVGALRVGPWKLVKNKLYHLGDDPTETKDLAAQYPQRLRQMVKKRQAIFTDAIEDSPYD